MAVRATQDVIAALSAENLAHTLVTQASVAVLADATGQTRATQLFLATAAVMAARARVTWFALEVLVWIEEVTMPSVFPSLPGLAYSVIKRPLWATGIGTSVSLREVRVGYAQSPLWEWDLTFEYLPDQQTASSGTSSDLKELLGFYLAQAGALMGFLFKDPDDHQVTGQVIGTTDGTATNWTLTRTYGGGAGTGTEPVGYVDTSAAFHVYLGGVLADPASYDLLTTTPVLQQVKFHAAPAADQVITVDMTYFYYVRFKDDHYDFEKFMDKLWSQRQVTLHSLRN